jgi:nitrogen fixation NifU-like protein
MQMEKLYQEIILDHYRTPHHFGLRDPFDTEVHHVNPTCGDEVTLRVRLEPAEIPAGSDGGSDGAGDLVVADISYDALGCSISQASTSVLTDLAIGRPLTEVMSTLAEFTAMVTSRGKIDGDEDVLGDGIAFAGVSKYPARVKCALLGWMAFKDAAAQSIDQSQPSAHQHRQPLADQHIQPASHQREGADQ